MELFLYTLYIVILDASAECQTATFSVNGNTGTTRSWDVKVTQYACGDMDSSGPPGCLQYYKETYGTLQKYITIRQELDLA